MEGLVLAIRAI